MRITDTDRPGGEFQRRSDDLGLAVQTQHWLAGRTTKDLHLAPDDGSNACPQGLRDCLFGGKTTCQAGRILPAYHQFTGGVDTLQKAQAIALNSPLDALYLDQVNTGANEEHHKTWTED